jgi:hypothetical protein
MLSHAASVIWLLWTADGISAMVKKCVCVAQVLHMFVRRTDGGGGIFRPGGTGSLHAEKNPVVKSSCMIAELLVKSLPQTVVFAKVFAKLLQ